MDLDELEEAESKATSAPWYVVNNDTCGPIYRTNEWNDGDCPGYGISEENAKFITLMRNHFKELLEIARVAKTVCNEIKDSETWLRHTESYERLAELLSGAPKTI
jgi:hypothetical protein